MGWQAASVMEKETLNGWIPLFLSKPGQHPMVEWAYMGGERFTEPFCHDTLQKIASRPFNHLFRRQSNLDLLRQRAQRQPGLPLRGIIFHMSRCGSTLVSQWLASLSDSVVLSEPEPLDTLLQWPAPHSDAETTRALLSALGQPRRNSDHCLYLKTDCWHMVHIDRLLNAFPGTPWLFLYRDPVEVLVSHQRMPGWQLVPGALTGHGLHAPDKIRNHPLSHGTWVLSVILQHAKRAIQNYSNGLLLNYSELTDAMNNRLPKHFGISPNSNSGAEQAKIFGHHAKQTHITFVPDSAEKHAAANTEILALAERWLNEPYQELEQLRLNSYRLETI